MKDGKIDLRNDCDGAVEAERQVMMFYILYCFALFFRVTFFFVRNKRIKREY